MNRAVRLTLPILLALTAPTAPAGAAVFTVTKTADTLDGACDPDDCSLREAVTEANRASSTDVIELPAGIYTLTRDRAGEDQNVTGDLDVNGPLILVGAGAGSTIVDGNGTDRVLDVRASVEIFGVTLRNGRVEDDGGGGLLARGTSPFDRVVVRRSVVSGNRAVGEDGDGGGLRSTGTLFVFESTVSGNRADGLGGGISGVNLGIEGSTVSGNSAGRSGGGISYPIDSTSWIVGSTLTANQAGELGGGIYAAPPLPAGKRPQLQSSIVAGNTAPAQPDCSGPPSAGYNMIGAGDGCNPTALDLAGTVAAPLDPKIAPLAGLGGPTPVHALLPGSPALDLVAESACTPSDQLGQTRTAPCDAGAVEVADHPSCLQGGPVLCLQDGRFRVTASWSNRQGGGAEALAVPLTDDTGNYWFFSPDNLELMVKVLDGCAVNGHWWIFTSGLTDLGVELRVDDLATGRTWTHSHAAGSTYAPRLDTSALDCAAAVSVPGKAAGIASDTPFLPPASAVIIPTRTDDRLAGTCDLDCSLREAVALSNAREGVEVIVLGRGVYTLSRPGRGEDFNVTGDLDVLGDLVILGDGAGRTVIDGGGVDRVLEADNANSRLEIHGVTLRNGRAEVVRNLDSGAGGAVNADDLTLVGCHLAGNWAEIHGGGVAGYVVTARDTTVSDNEAEVGGGIGHVPTLRLANVTVSGNRAQYGGGLLIDATDQELTGVTITGNSAVFDGGGLYAVYATCPSFRWICRTDFAMRRSIVAGNSAAHGPDCFGMEAQAANNVYGIDDGGCNRGPTDRAGTPSAPLDPKLTALGDHGGSTPTHALLEGSPAIDIAPTSGCLASDQRGRPRPAGLCDAGAVERLPGCQPDATTLCLGAGDRFRVTAHWTVRGESGDGRSLPLSLDIGDSGAFWFFNPSNLELTLKVLDGCGVNGRFWVFLSGLTDVGVDVTVEDTLTGKTWTYTHAAGTALQPRLETSAFTCP